MRFLLAATALLVSACSTIPSPNEISRAQALEIAGREVKSRGIDLSAFDQPTVEKTDNAWLVSYEGRDRSIVGNHFGISISTNRDLVLFIGGE